jgi:hypothetical protein
MVPQVAAAQDFDPNTIIAMIRYGTPVFKIALRDQ